MKDLSHTQIPSKGGRQKGSGAGLPFHSKFPMSERITTFWKKVKKLGDNECWEWTGRIEKTTGYGKFVWGGKSPTSAHRFSWIITNGEIPHGMFVCHHCDNRSCQNPKHLFLGTAKDNNRDRDLKGRGSKPPVRSNITAEQVRKIRELWIPYVVTMSILANRFGVSVKTIESAIRKWKHIT